jgi:hypothetical protein
VLKGIVTSNKQHMQQDMKREKDEPETRNEENETRKAIRESKFYISFISESTCFQRIQKMKTPVSHLIIHLCP